MSTTAPSPIAGLKHATPSLYAALGLMTVLWSMNYYAAKVLTADMPPFVAAGLRSECGAILVALYCFGIRGRPLPTAGLRGALPFMAVGTIGVAINQIFFVEGMSRTSVAHGALIIALTPAIVLVLAALIGQERITAVKVAGLAMATLGIACLQLGADPLKGASFLGDLLVLGASTSFGTYTVLSKRFAGMADSLTVVTYGFIGSALAFLPGLAWTLPAAHLGAVSTKGWLALLYMSLGTSAICYAIYSRALESMPASRVSALSYLQPLIAISTAVPLLGEPITKSLVLGGALTLAGVLLVERG